MPTTPPGRPLLRPGVAAAMLFASFGAGVAHADPDAEYQWSTIGDINNPATPPLETNPWDFNVMSGRGSVPYAYRAARTEVSTSQWLEFLNTFIPRAEVLPWFQRIGGTSHRGPYNWGAGPDLDYKGPGRRYFILPFSTSAQQPVGGIPWREAAMYCNWLHNGKSSDPASLLTGAYDASTWGTSQSGFEFFDDLGRMPGAKYFMPTLDEQLKAMFYDPNRFGDGLGGWWYNKNMSDLPGIPGVPGVGTTTAGMTNTGLAWSVPLGAYVNQQSAYGLWDTSGGAAELSEFATPLSPPYGTRMGLGVAAGGDIRADAIGDFAAGSMPDTAFPTDGLRVYSVIPTPSTAAICLAFGVAHGCRPPRRRERPNRTDPHRQASIAQAHAPVGIADLRSRTGSSHPEAGRGSARPTQTHRSHNPGTARDTPRTDRASRT